MDDEIGSMIGVRLRTPRAAALAGILFGVLLGTAFALIRLSIPSNPADNGTWLTERRDVVGFALGLVPFAGIAFLWFIGVVRDRLGDLEDRFFATVFLGSGLLFLAMTFAASAIAGGMLAVYSTDATHVLNGDLYAFSRAVMYRITNIYAIKMAGVFMISLATIWVRTRTMPRVLAILTYGVAVLLLVTISYSLWVVEIFPIWVFTISVYILVGNFRRPTTIS
jgi:hypothetical protein